MFNNNNNYNSQGVPSFMAYGGVPVGLPRGAVPQNATGGAVPQWSLGQQNPTSSFGQPTQFAQNNTQANDGNYTTSNYRLGTLSGLYESNHNPAAIGTDNAGGPSYGMYQIATTPGTMKSYISYLSQNQKYKDFADALNTAGGDIAARQKSQSFIDTWGELSKNNDFNDSQYNFIVDTHLNPLINSVQEKDILNLDNRHPVVKDALYSMSVQHRGAPKIVNNALQGIKETYGNNPANINDETILRSLYDSRKNYVLSLPESQYPGDGKITAQEKMNIINKRYPKELQDALNYLR